MKKILLSGIVILMSFFSSAQLDSTSLLAFQSGTGPSYLSIPTPAGSNLRVTGSFTIEAWVLPNSSVMKESSVAETYGSPNTGGFVFRIDPQNKIRVSIMGSSASEMVTIAGTTPLTMDEWSHIAVKYSSADGTSTVYLNGVEDGMTAGTLNVINLNAEMKIGGRIDNNQLWKKIGIDDFRIWNYARTTAEINANKNACLDGTETGLLAAYDFEGLTNSTVTDKSGNGNNGAIVNFTSQNIHDGVTRCIGSTIVGLSEYAMESIQLYPNPTTSILNVSSETIINKIEVVNIYGEIMKITTETSFSIEELPAGVYFAIISTDINKHSLRFVKQ